MLILFTALKYPFNHFDEFKSCCNSFGPEFLKEKLDVLRDKSDKHLVLNQNLTCFVTFCFHYISGERLLVVPQISSMIFCIFPFCFIYIIYQFNMQFSLHFNMPFKVTSEKVS